MGNAPILIQLKNICYGYPGAGDVLKNIDFSLHTGEKVGLIGGNGSGKTTFLHIIIGILSADSGELEILNKPVRSEKDFLGVRQRVGLLFQNSDDQLFSPTVLEDVAFGPLNLGKDPDEACQIARETLVNLGLEGFEDRITHRLSGGEKKLVALATILAMKPAVLLLDEPTSGLDERTKERLTEILKNLDTSYIIVSHEYDFLASNTDSIYAMQDGVLDYRGKSAFMHNHYHIHPAGEIPHQHSEPE